ncbi:MAG: hypothetical protein JSU86_05395, partial [Phycisphaerales bacterium]
AYDARFVNEGQSDSINATMLQANSVRSSEIADDAVGSSEIAADAVTGYHIAAGAVGSSEITGYAVDTSEIAPGAVTMEKIGSSAVTTSKIADRMVTYDKLEDPLYLGSNIWDWDLTTGRLGIDKTSDGPALEIVNWTTTTYSDCAWFMSMADPGSTTTWALYATTYNGTAGFFSKDTDDDRYALKVHTPSSTSEGLYVQGSTVATGTKSAAIETSQGMEAIFSVESPEVEIYASGSGHISGGEAYVSFDPLFTEAVSPEVKIRVTVTPVGAWSALYVEFAEPEGFSVKSGAGDDSVEFHWMACGRRNGYEARPAVAIPDPVEEDRLREIKELAHAERAQSE